MPKQKQLSTQDIIASLNSKPVEDLIAINKLTQQLIIEQEKEAEEKLKLIRGGK